MLHKPLLILPIVGATVAFIVMVVFNILSAGGSARGGVFLNFTNQISDKFNLEITPAGYTFSIWSVIYIWQGLFLGYGFSTICRQGPTRDEYIYCDMHWQPFYIYLLYMLNNALNIAWLFLWDRQLLAVSFVFLALIAFSLHILGFLSCRLVTKSSEEYKKFGLGYEIWLARLLVHNTFGIYGTWTTIATLLNFGSMLAYEEGIQVAQSTASTVVLSILTVEVVGYSFADFFFLDNYIRYLFTPYLVVPFAVGGSLAKNWNPENTNAIFVAVLLAVSLALLVIKICLMIWRSIKNPFFQEYDLNKISEESSTSTEMSNKSSN